MDALGNHCADSDSARILTRTYHSPRGKNLYRASSDEFISFIIGYIELWLARQEAGDRELAPQENPVSLTHFRRKRVPNHIVLWMWYQGHVDGFQFASPSVCDRSPNTPQTDLLFGPRSSFWLTDRGDAFADVFLSNALFPEVEKVFEAIWDRLLLGQLLPSYDVEERVFHWGAHLLKVFRQPAENQELILSAEEELIWPAWIDDPLPRIKGKNPKVRLHETIKNLNRNQQVSDLVHFRGDGTGTRIGWLYPQGLAQALTRDR